VTEIGIVTAMRMEARCITRRRLPFNQKASLGERAAIWLCGIGDEAARKAAEGLAASGVSALMSFGFAGALDSNLRPGDLVLPEAVHAHDSLPVDPGWRSRLRESLPASLNILDGVLATSNVVLCSAREKLELGRSTGACAVDMESSAVAETAAHAGIPFLAVRVISDAVEFSPPPILLNTIRPDGSVDLSRLLPLLLRRSITPHTLFRLAMESRAACSTLSAVARHAEAELGIA
jgi:adenosylhomocysteine nucleosidase